MTRLHTRPVHGICIAAVALMITFPARAALLNYDVEYLHKNNLATHADNSGLLWVPDASFETVAFGTQLELDTAVQSGNAGGGPGSGYQNRWHYTYFGTPDFSSSPFSAQMIGSNPWNAPSIWGQSSYYNYFIDYDARTDFGTASLSLTRRASDSRQLNAQTGQRRQWNYYQSIHFYNFEPPASLAEVGAIDTAKLEQLLAQAVIEELQFSIYEYVMDYTYTPEYQQGSFVGNRYQQASGQHYAGIARLTSIPTPATWMLVGLGLIGAGLCRRRSRIG